MKRQGLIDVSRHLIGQRKPIVAFIGLSALSGCGGESTDYTLYTKFATCSDNEGRTHCDATYQKALAEAKRTAMKYQSERDCIQDYGNICLNFDGVWQPKVAGFISGKVDQDFSLPFFTSTNPASSHFGYAFLADGEILGKYRDANGVAVGLADKYLQPLPDSILEPMNVSIPEGNTSSVENRSGSSVISNLATAYILSGVIDEAGDYLSERERTKRYKECMQRGDSDCYQVSSGTGRISTSTSTTTYQKSKPKLKTRQVKTYKSSPKATTISKGGFGRTGSVRGGFGG